MSRIPVAVLAFLIMLICIMLWAAGLVPAALLWRAVVGTTAALFIWTTVEVIVARWRQQPAPTKIPDQLPRFVTVTAMGQAKEGELLTVDLLLRQAQRYEPGRVQ